MIYDTLRIGMGVAPDFPGGCGSFADVANKEELPFFNIRNSSEVGLAYTNVTSKDKTPWPFYLESLGVRFHLPDPFKLDEARVTSGNLAMAKMFETMLPDHMWGEFSIREDVRLIIKPSMCPPGYGPYGAMIMNLPVAPGVASSTFSSGEPVNTNRWKWVGADLEIPRDTPIKFVLKMSAYAKLLLKAMDTLPVLAFTTPADPDTGARSPLDLVNEAHIEVTLRGKREVQQRGDYHV